MLQSIKRLIRNEKGSSALEFGLVAPMFFGFLFTFYDVGLHMLRQALLASSVDRTVRELRIGNGPQNESEFITAVCQRALILGSGCENTMVVSQIRIDRGSQLPDNGIACAQRSGPTVFKPSLQWVQGRSPDIMYVRVCALAPSLIASTWGVGGSLVDGNGDNRIFTATAYMTE